MKVELRVGTAVVSCETDHRPDPSGKCSENDAARQALFERLLDVAIAQMNQWMYTPQPPSEYVRELEKALEPVLAVEGAIEQAKRTDRKIYCEDNLLFQCLDAVAEAQKIMQKYREQEKSVAEIEKKIAEATA